MYTSPYVLISDLFRILRHDEYGKEAKVKISRSTLKMYFREIKRVIGIGVVEVGDYQIREPITGISSLDLINRKTTEKESLYESNLDRVVKRKKNLRKI